MKDYEPGMSFGRDVAEAYDDAPRGDEGAAGAFLEALAGGGLALETPSAPAGSRCPSPPEASA